MKTSISGAKISVLLPLSLFLFFANLYCLDSAERENSSEQTARVRAERIDVPDPLPAHPRLFLNTDDITRLKAWIARESWLSEYVDSFVAKTRKRIDDVPKISKEVINRENRDVSMLANEFALAYVLTDERVFADAAAKILLSYVPVYESYPVSHIKGKAMPSTLNEARWAGDYACAYDLIYNSGALSDDDKTAIESRVLKPCGEVLRICNHKTRSNWRARAIAGVGIVGFCINDRELIDEALHGYRDEQGRVVRDGFVQHVSRSILNDGIFYERSYGYQAFTTDSYFLLLEAARGSGVDLWHHESPGHPLDAGADVERTFGPSGFKSVKPIFDSLFYRTFSDGTVSVVANASTDHFLSWRYYDAAWRAYRDPKFAFAARIPRSSTRPWAEPNPSDTTRLRTATDLIWLEPDLPEGHFDLEDDATIGLNGIHTNGCTLLPSGGYAVLRQSAKPGAVGVAMTFGRWGSGHSHADKLSIVVSDGDRKAIREVNYFGYGAEEHLTWDSQTIAHNTVTVDETSQAPQGNSHDEWAIPPPGEIVRGRPLLFYPGERIKVFRADCTDAYEDVRLERTIVLIDSVILDFYLCQSAREHTYDYAMHIEGSFENRGDGREGPLSESFGYRHITDLHTSSAPQTIRFAPEGQIDLLTPGEVTTGLGILGKEEKQRPVLVVRQRGGDVAFVSAIRFDETRDGDVTLSEFSGDSQSVTLPSGLIVTSAPSGVTLRDAAGVVLEEARQEK